MDEDSSSQNRELLLMDKNQLKEGLEVSSVHNPASKGVVQSYEDQWVYVLWEGYRVSERWHVDTLNIREDSK